MSRRMSQDATRAEDCHFAAASEVDFGPSAKQLPATGQEASGLRYLQLHIDSDLATASGLHRQCNILYNIYIYIYIYDPVPYPIPEVGIKYVNQSGKNQSHGHSHGHRHSS